MSPLHRLIVSAVVRRVINVSFDKNQLISTLLSLLQSSSPFFFSSTHQHWRFFSKCVLQTDWKFLSCSMNSPVIQLEYTHREKKDSVQYGHLCKWSIRWRLTCCALINSFLSLSKVPIYLIVSIGREEKKESWSVSVHVSCFVYINVWNEADENRWWWNNKKQEWCNPCSIYPLGFVCVSK